MVLKVSITQKHLKRNQKMTPKMSLKKTQKITPKMSLKKTQKMTPKKSPKKRKGRARHTIAAVGTWEYPVVNTATGVTYLKRTVPVCVTEAGFQPQALRPKRNWR